MLCGSAEGNVGCANFTSLKLRVTELQSAALMQLWLFAGSVSEPLLALQKALTYLIEDPVSNIPHLTLVETHLRALPLGEAQLTSLAKHLSRVLPSTVAWDRQGYSQIQQAKLQAMIAQASTQTHSQTDTTPKHSRVGLAVLLLGLWCHTLKQQIASHHASMSGRADDRGPDQPAADWNPSSSASAGPQADSASAPITDRDLPATSSASLRAAAAASAAAWVDHMSMMASDAGDEEDCQSDSLGTTTNSRG